jgi:ubiquinone/menaquinone biosynthesis C-methylase UbiE
MEVLKMDNLRNEFFRRLLIDSGIGKGMRILDVGCGTGNLSIMASELMGDTGEVIGFDISPEALAKARKAVAEKSLSTAAFVQSDIAELPDNFGVFDMIIGRRVLMYQSDVSKAIGSLLPFLAKNGKMVFQESDCRAASFSSPALPLHTKALNWIWDTVAKEGGNIHIGTQLYSEINDRRAEPCGIVDLHVLF